MRVLNEERGVATVLVVGAMAVLMLLVGVGVQIGAAVVTRHRVAAAADLAALAAAGQLVVGGDRACERAGRIVERMSASMTACRISGWEAYVEVTARPPGWAALSGTANAHARAGPAEVPGGR
jgi:secretion/DNA translocation related TadE-like protein